MVSHIRGRHDCILLVYMEDCCANKNIIFTDYYVCTNCGSRLVKIKNIKKQNLLYGCFKKQSTQKISNQKMKLKERDKFILE